MSAKLLLLCSFSAATMLSGSVGIGTEASAELTDQLDDVQYHQAHVGSKNHRYLDIVSGWFHYDGLADNVTVTLKASDASSLSTLPADWQISCYFQGQVVLEGQPRGRLGFGWAVHVESSISRRPVLTSSVWHDPSETGQSMTRPIKHGFVMNTTEPGYYAFSVDRQSLLSVGDGIRELIARCYEWYQPVGSSPVYQNFDSAGSSAEYVWNGLTPSGHSDAPQPHATPTGSEVTLTPAEGTAAIGVSISVGTLLVLVILERRRRA